MSVTGGRHNAGPFSQPYDKASQMSKNEVRTTTKTALKVLKVKDLKVDMSYQRPLREKHKKIAREFDQDAFGVPQVAEREGPEYFIVDGQQRVAALKILGRSEVRCNVFYSEGPEYEALMFRKINRDRTGLQPAELFQADLAAGDATAWAIKEIAEQSGYKIGKPGDKSLKLSEETRARSLGCHSTMIRIYRQQGADALRFALDVVKEAWPDDPNGVREIVIGGLGGFYSRMKGEVDKDRMIARLRVTTPARMVYSASLGMGNRTATMVDLFMREYRKRAPKKA